ncbi:hypothetical protein MUGA111182_17860 [Mucilaginibacter galii]|uniref:3-isopropylmalate dehydratase n=1 Tax=Mucilaginibacter galii TaxID=2005073 RepID=A0A917JD85_9SPHI|nr:hypothetical protein [Mucilaginibacter galii]GGI52427.1 hypothetical protein GCM10011425_36390 [Mucilaginibacter galii]
MENPLIVHDLNGEAVEVTDLNLALMQADDYRHYHLSGKRNIALQQKQQAYWQDLYQKLLKLAERQS